MENKTTQHGTTSEEAVKNLYRDLLNSWNQYNAAGFAELFMESGSIVGFDGSQANSRQEIFDHLDGIFAHHKPAAFVHIIREVRFLTLDTALLRAVVSMVPPGQQDINPAVNAIQSMVTVREGNQFRIALFQNTPAAFHGRPEASEQLTVELRAALQG